MSETSEKIQRRLRKLEKKKALVRLADREQLLSSGNSRMATDHEKMIAALESDILDPRQTHSDQAHKRVMDDDSEDEDDINKAYRAVVNKKQKTSATATAASLYIDTVYLVTNKHKQLGFDLNQKEKLDFSEKPLIHISGVQHLLSYIILAQKSMYRPRWCSLSYISSIPQTLFVVIRNVSSLDVTVAVPSCWRDLLNICPSEQRIEFMSSLLTKSSTMSDLFMLPLNTLEKSRRIRNYSSSPSVVDQQIENNSSQDALVLNLDVENHRDVFPRTSLLLSTTELASEGFPLPEHATWKRRDYQDFAHSKAQYAPVTDRSPIFSVDCEMVKSVHGKQELARICVVDEKLKIVYESLVKPTNKVRDYLTQYSGVSEAILKNVTTTLIDVQRALRNLLPADAIICGQSVSSDLTALKITHPYIIDTTVAYNLKGMPHSKTSLKKLAQHFLNKQIQQGNRGHSPAEDAITAMQLILLKLKIGYYFGNVLAERCLVQTPRRFFLTKIEAMKLADLEVKQQSESKSPQRLDTPAEQKLKDAQFHFNRKHIPQYEVNMFDLFSGHNKTAHYATAQSSLAIERGKATVDQCSGNKKVTKSAIQAVRSTKNNLVVAELELEKELNDNSTHAQRRMKRIDQYVGDMYSALPPHSLLLAAVEGSAGQPGMLMYNVKKRTQTQADQRSDNTQAKDDDEADVYSSMYGL